MARSFRFLVLLMAACTAVVASATLSASASAAPTFRPHIDVFLADGVTPLGDTTVHPGDELVVRGRGFDPNANRDGLPLPVPPGVPHGTFIAFGAFAPDWKPSAGAPESARATDRLGVQWALSADALAQVPDVPFDMRRTIRQQWVPLERDGAFTARLQAGTPADIPAGARYGVYTYGAAGATNAAQELSVPVDYSAEPGPNTPVPAPRNLLWGYSPGFHRTITDDVQGGIYGTDGADIDDAGRMTFDLVDESVTAGSGVLRYRGTVVAFSRFHLAEIALADPVIRVVDGQGVLSMRTSTTNMNGTDAMRRVDIADVDLRQIGSGRDVLGAQVRFRPGIGPEALAVLSLGPAAPMDLRFPVN
ncbi:HtaA domain-containing protein [Gordonia sp. PKS22-38]|uniref:HtaA domain-containing protein n=1 Tax=Gordonia prachuapensis TaxID=3115651 RepID=A0ABU7N052_9ACTN|nr:HtaA domain-containing protein [Gordonia sp. PKS22-38]